MTKEELRDYYKIIEIDKVNEDIAKIDLYHAEGDNNRHVRLLFAYNKLYYTGDMGTYVFGNFVHNIKTFFKGSEINPGYWSEKCESASRPILNEIPDIENINKALSDLCSDVDISEEELEEAKIGYDLEGVNQFELLENLNSILYELNIDEAKETAYEIYTNARDFNSRYLYACEVIQWVENEILED